jgi:hypothetical protein
MLANESAAFDAETLDQFEDPISGTVTWSVSGGGSLSPTTGSSTTFTSSGSEGTFTVTASSGSVQGSATVSVEPPPTITILQPVAGDVWYVGTTRNITWTATGVSNFMVLYRQDGGAYSPISEGTMEYSIDTWTVPNSPSTQTEILVRDYFGNLATTTVIIEIRSVTDSDGDGMDDIWELGCFGNLDQDGTADGDGDGRTDYEEFMGGTDPLIYDGDGDGDGGNGGGSGISCAPARTPGTAGLAAALALAALVVCAAGRAHRQTAIDGRI